MHMEKNEKQIYTIKKTFKNKPHIPNNEEIAS